MFNPLRFVEISRLIEQLSIFQDRIGSLEFC